MASLADLVGGFQQGVNWKAGRVEAGEARRARQLQREGAKRALEIETGGPLSAEISGLYDPYEMSLGKMMRGVFTGEFRRQRQERNAVAAGRSALGAQGVPTAQQAMATGVDRFQNPYSAGAAAPDRMQQLQQGFADGGYATGGGFGEEEEEGPVSRTLGAIKRSALDIPLEAGRQARKAVSGWGDASARERGAMARQAVTDVAGGLGAGAVGMTQALSGAEFKRPVVEFAKGALGLTGEVQDQGPPPPSAAEPDVAAAAAQVPTEKPVEAAPVSAAAGAATSRPGPSTVSPNQPFVGPPEPNQMASQLGAVDFMPDDMPSMGTRDWVAYRQEMVPALMMQGMTAEQAHDQVSTMQHKGFMRYGQQAALMLQAGNLQGAARSLKAAYQYFPNGSDVKFGFQNGNLVAMGTDEQTGKPVGKPQAITPEYLAAMMVNFSDPSKYLAWTKDWRDEVFREREYSEVTKPAAQDAMTRGTRALDIAQQNANTGQIEAGARLSAAQGKDGFTRSDLARAEDRFENAVATVAIEDERAADKLKGVMGAVRVRTDENEFTDAEIVDLVKAAYAGEAEAITRVSEILAGR